jgi:hypothetical protein
MSNGRWLGLVVAVALLVVGSAPAWSEDEDEGGSPAEPADEPAQPPDDPPDDKPDDNAGDKPDEPAADPDDDRAAGAGTDSDSDSGSADEPAGTDTDTDTGSGADPDNDKDDDNDAGSAAGAADTDGDGDPDPAGAATDTDGDGDVDGADAGGDSDAAEDAEDEEDEPPYVEYDTDGDGIVEADEAAFEKEYEAAFADIPDVIDDDALDARPDATELTPSLSVEAFRALVRLAKSKVLPRLEAKIERKQAKRMLTFTYLVCGFSLLGFLLLLTPLFLRKKYPGQGGLLFKYAALAAVTWLVTVNLFGGVLYGMRTAQGALAGLTNPQLAIAGGMFDTLDEHAEDYIVMGKELFAPTLEQLQGNADQQPTATLIENGTKIIGDAKVFLSMAKLFKKVDFLFGILPIILLGVTLLLFALAIKPTLIEIIKLPTRAAAGEAGAGREVMRQSMRRIVGELKATAVTIGVLAVLTLLSAFVLGRIVGPALDALLSYFSLAVIYLQFQAGASSGLVFCTLFGVIFFLVLNLATLILSMSFFLGKTQKIFQQRFNDGVPLGRHTRFFKWGIPSVFLVQVFPLIFVVIAQKALAAINDKVMGDATSADVINWKAILLAGPLFLVFAYIALFWAARGIKAIRFLQSYKVKIAKDATQL